VSLGFRIAAGDRAVYVAPATPSGHQLLSVPADGSSSPVLLGSPTNPLSWWLDPAGDFAYFCASSTLWRIPVDGSAAATAVTSCPFNALFFSADGTVLLIVHSQGFGERLSRMPADGSGPLVQLHQTASGNADTSYNYGEIRFAPDGLHVVFTVESRVLLGCEDFFCEYDCHDLGVFSVPSAGGSPAVQLDTSGFGDDFEFEVGSPEDRLVYRDQGTVYSIAYDGTQRATLSPPGWTSWETFACLVIADDLEVRGSDVVFEARNPGEFSLLRAPLDGSQLGAPLFDASPLSVADTAILASGMVVFRGESTPAGLYTVPLGGGTPVLLTPTLMANHGVRSSLVHPNELTVAFLSDAATNDKDELYRVPVDGSEAPLKLNATLFQAAGDVSSYSFTPDGVSVAYVADPLTDGLDGVFGAPLDGLGPVVQYNEPGPTSAIGGDVLEFQPTGDGTQVVYRADEEEDESFDLFVAGSSGSGQAANLTALLIAPASVQAGFVLAPSDDRVVFQAKEHSLSALDFSLHSAPTTPGPAPIELDSSASAFPLPLAIAPDGTRIVYRKGGELAPSDTALLSALLDGSSPPVTLHAPFAAGRAVTDFQIDALGQFVVHRADEELDGVFELFSVPLDGSAPPVRLHPPLPAGRTTQSSYKISPDGARVVFLADREVAGRFDLHSVAVDGTSAPHRLNQTLLDTRDVVDFVISPDGRAVVYRANALAATQFDLFRVPIEGLSPPHRRSSGEVRRGAVPLPRRLSQIPAGRAVLLDYRFTADGAFVLYRANPVVGNRFELFRVSSGGSSAPVQLSGPLVSGGRVSSFALSLDQSRIVYLADAVVDEVFELYSVPLAGGPVVRLDALPSFADVSSYGIDPDSQRVVYLADRDADNVLELFEAPLDGSAPAERLNASLPVGGDVESDFVSLSGGRTLYRADQIVNDVFELFVFLH
jgi:Tol biopolymer transport system component